MNFFKLYAVIWNIVLLYPSYLLLNKLINVNNNLKNFNHTCVTLVRQALLLFI